MCKYKQNDSTFLLCTYLLLLSHPIYRCVSTLSGYMGVEIPYLLEIIYCIIVVLAVKGLLKHKLFRNSALLLLATWCFFGVNYFISTEAAREYYISGNVRIMLIVTIPVAALCVTRVNNWDKLFNATEFLIVSDCLVVLSLIGKVLEMDNTNYMSFSYDLLPVWGMLFIAAFCYKRKIQWIFFIVGVIEGLIYGARGPLLWLAVLFVSVMFTKLYQEKRKLKYFAYMILVILVSYVMIQSIVPFIVQSQLSDASYVVNRLKEGSISSDAGRQNIYIQCRQILKNMGWSIQGLYFDRTVLSGNVYAHNIFYEVFISLGWYFGSVFIVGLFVLLLNRLIHSVEMGTIVWLFFICTMFLRFLISGSIFEESVFVIFICAIISLKNKELRENRDE